MLPGPDLNDDHLNDSPQRSTFRDKSYFVPPDKRNASIDTFGRLVHSDMELLLKNEVKINLTI